MDYLVVSDLHGSLSGAAIIPECLQFHHLDRILALGDFLYHGPRNDLPDDYAPKKVIEILNPLKDRITAVRGNCDAEVDQMVLQFPITADYSVLYLGSRRVFISHGHIYGPDHLPALNPEDCFLSGHTHIPTAVKKDGIYLLNPGSTAIPKGGSCRSYAILNESGFTLYQTDHHSYAQILFDAVKER